MNEQLRNALQSKPTLKSAREEFVYPPGPPQTFQNLSFTRLPQPATHPALQKVLGIFPTQHSPTTCCAGVSSTTVLIGSFDSNVRLWDVTTGACLRTYSGHSNTVTALTLLSPPQSPSDFTQFLTSSGDRTLRLWDLESGECLRVYQHAPDPYTEGDEIPGKPIGLPFQPIPVAVEEGCFEGHTRPITCVATFLCPQLLRQLSSESTANSADASSPSLHRYVASGGEDNSVRVWETTSSNCIRVLNGHNSVVSCLVALPNVSSSSHPRLLSGSLDSSMCIWDVVDGACLHILGSQSMGSSMQLVRAVSLLPFSTNTNLLMAAYGNGVMRVWDLTTCTVLKEIDRIKGGFGQNAMEAMAVFPHEAKNKEDENEIDAVADSVAAMDTAASATAVKESSTEDQRSRNTVRRSYCCLVGAPFIGNLTVLDLSCTTRTNETSSITEVEMTLRDTLFSGLVGSVRVLEVLPQSHTMISAGEHFDACCWNTAMLTSDV